MATQTCKKKLLNKNWRMLKLQFLILWIWAPKLCSLASLSLFIPNTKMPSFSQQSSFARVTKVVTMGTNKWASILVGVRTHLTTMWLKMKDYCKHNLSWHWHLESIGLFHNTNFDFVFAEKLRCELQYYWPLHYSVAGHN